MQSLKIRGPFGSLDFQTYLVLGPLQKLLLPSDVSTGATSATADAPKFWDTLTLLQPGEQIAEVAPKCFPRLRPCSHLNFAVVSHCRVHYSFDFDLKIHSGQVWKG